MIFDSLLLASVADELQRTLVGGKVERVSQPDPLEVVLRIFHAGDKHDLLLSCEAETARVHLTSIRRDNPPAPPPFCAVLRKYLDGAWVEGISLPLGFGERVIRFDFRATDGAPYALIAELMGRHSNLIFVSDAGTVLGAAKLISRALSRYREVLPGVRYLPPPRQRGKIDPLAAPSASVEGEPEPGDEADWLQSRFAGVSPLLAREVVLRAAVPLSAQSLRHALNDVLSAARLANYAPRIWTDATGATLGAYPIPLRSVPAARQHPRASISLALDNAAASLTQRDTSERARDALLTALRKARKTREKEREEIGRGLENAKRADEYQQAGELLTANGQSIVRGQTTATVPDFYSEAGQTRTVTLDPALDARENAERYFKRARKARDSVANLQDRLEMLDAELAALVPFEQDAADATMAAQIAFIREAAASLLTRTGRPDADTEGEPHRRQTPRFDGHKIRAFTSVDGWEILVGESATANDFLTTKVATGSDIWLHVRAATSAHGVIRAQNRPASVSPATLQQAAELVAARSAVKHSSLIPVDYTLKKYVRKPRKSAPGSVTYQNEKTLYVTGIDG